MPKIQVTPSLNNSANGKQELDLHPYYKILGKRHNNDYCHACGEYGKILCCDMCTASFHLLCHDPPLNESDIPAGQWFCHSCKYLKVSNNHVNNKLNDIEDESVDLPEINNEIKISSKSHSTMIVKKKRKLDYNESLDNIYCTDDSKVNYDPVEKKKFKASIDEDFEVDSETHLCVMNGNLSDSYSESADNNFCNDSTQAGIISDAFRIIIKEAVRSNPKQFELPEEYENKYSLLPSKEEKEIDYNDLDGCNLIKQPIRICFYCKRKFTPFIAKDWCKSWFREVCAYRHEPFYLKYKKPCPKDLY